MKKIILLAFGVLLTSIASAQSEKKADEYFENFDFKKAIEIYDEIISDSKKPKQDIIEKLADCYFNIGDYGNAQLWYGKLYELRNKNLDEKTFIKYVQSVKSFRDYDKADALIKDYYKKDINRLKMIASQKQLIDSISKEDVEPLYTVQNIEANTPVSDFAPMFYNQSIVFASTRDTSKVSEKIYTWNEQPYLDTYIAERDMSDGELHNVSKFMENLESSFHDATLTFSPDYKTVYFTRNFVKKNKLELNDDGISNLKILKGDIVDNKIVNIKPLQFNSPDYSCAHPSLSPDGKLLYFVSDMPGGYGESDIYVTEVFEDGSTNGPVNLGSVINTAGREMFPYVTDETLYFASDSHYGLGGLDIFESKIKSKTNYSLPQNLGAPVNSNMDDFSFIIDEQNTGYFASNRFNGKGDDDIYSFTKKELPATQTYSGLVLDEKTKEPISDATIKIYDLFNEFISETMSESDGSYTITLTCASAYKVVFTKLEYSEKAMNIETTEEPGAVFKEKNVYLIPYESIVEKEGNVEKIKVNPIYFDYDKSEITQKAIPELEKVVFALNEFPNIKIKIESHTDSRGNDTYNTKLSDRRAKATRNYIISRGVEASRIESAIGYGESKLKNHCANGIICSEEDHSVNRRSDFIIIQK